MEYFVLKVRVGRGDDAVVETLPDGAPAGWRFHEGESLAADIAAPLDLPFSDNFPDGRVARDFVANILDLLIVSPRVRGLLEAGGVTNAEFLPARLLDHKGKVAEADYAVVNLLGSQDAIDMKSSRVTMGRIDKDQIDGIDELRLRRDAIDAGAVMFRARNMRRLILVREDLKSALESAGVSGYRTFAADGWNGFDF